MASVKKHFSQQINRLNQAISQSIGRSEKSDVLGGDLQNIDQRVEYMVDILKHTKKKLVECLRSKKTSSGKDDSEKRRTSFEEYKLSQTIVSEAKNMESIFPGGLLSDVMTQYGEVLSFLVQDMVKLEILIENNVLEKVNKFSEDLEKITEQKDKLKKLVLDMDSARSRLNAAQSRNDERVNEIQDEFDNAYTKVETFKDSFATELYTLASKEVEMAGLYETLMQIQIEYHASALARLQNVQPSVAARIGSYARRPVYGYSLDDHLNYSGREIALVLDVCCRTLVELGLRDEGLFRISGNSTKVRKLKAAFDAGETELIDTDREPHSVAGALKSYLRELPEPLMCSGLYDEWIMVANISDPEKRIAAVRDVLGKLPTTNYANLRYLIKFLSKLLDNQAHTKMSSQNLAIVMAPNMIWSSSEGEGFGLSSAHGALVEFMVTNANELFPGDIVFSSGPALGNGGIEGNWAAGRQDPLLVDVSLRGSRGASNDSLNQISPARGTSRKSKPPPPPPAPIAALSPLANSNNARASFHGLQSDRSTPMKAVEINDAAVTPPTRPPLSIVNSGHRKSNSLDRPVRPPWTVGAELKKAVESKSSDSDVSVANAIPQNETPNQTASAKVAGASSADSLKGTEETEATRSSTFPRPQQRAAVVVQAPPPPIPIRTSIPQARPGNLGVTDASQLAPTMVRVSMSDDSDDNEPIMADIGDNGSARQSEQVTIFNGGELRTIAPPLLPQPAPRRHPPTSPKDVSYVSVIEELDSSLSPTSPVSSSSIVNSSQLHEAAQSSTTPARPKPPIPSKPRALESPDKEKDSIIRL